MICAAIRFAAAISFVPVLRNTLARTPSDGGRTGRASHFGRVGEVAGKTSALCTEQV